MHRTQIYLTEEQQRRIGARAEAAGVSKAEVIRRILDGALGIDDGSAERIAAVRATAGILDDYPDWPDWLRAVRTGSAADRLKKLGL